VCALSTLKQVVQSSEEAAMCKMKEDESKCSTAMGTRTRCTLQLELEAACPLALKGLTPAPPRSTALALMASYTRAAVQLALQPVVSGVALLSRSWAVATSTVEESQRLLLHSWAFLTRDRRAPAKALAAMPPLLLEVARDAHSYRCSELLAQLMLDLVALMSQKEVRTITMAVSAQAGKQRHRCSSAEQ
jgi:hypothetical protein